MVQQVLNRDCVGPTGKFGKVLGDAIVDVELIVDDKVVNSGSGKLLRQRTKIKKCSGCDFLSGFQICVTVAVEVDNPFFPTNGDGYSRNAVVLPRHKAVQVVEIIVDDLVDPLLLRWRFRLTSLDFLRSHTCLLGEN